ncbi:large ribosomal subunit protein mL59 [Monosporozyma unispora]|nr:54S ribosomal protein L25, mitochondrial [Kazachstania unispora]
MSTKYFETLPSKLKNFFQKYPPGKLRYVTHPTSITNPMANPFISNRHPITNRFRDPVYSARRMSDIVKLASRYGVEDLLPTWQGVKLFHQEKYDKKQFMKGVMWPKLHKHEREPRVMKSNEEIDSILAKARVARQVKKVKKVKTWV